MSARYAGRDIAPCCRYRRADSTPLIFTSGGNPSMRICPGATSVHLDTRVSCRLFQRRREALAQLPWPCDFGPDCRGFRALNTVHVSGVGSQKWGASFQTPGAGSSIAATCGSCRELELLALLHEFRVFPLPQLGSGKCGYCVALQDRVSQHLRPLTITGIWRYARLSSIIAPKHAISTLIVDRAFIGANIEVRPKNFSST